MRGRGERERELDEGGEGGRGGEVAEFMTPSAPRVIIYERGVARLNQLTLAIAEGKKVKRPHGKGST